MRRNSRVAKLLLPRLFSWADRSLWMDARCSLVRSIDDTIDELLSSRPSPQAGVGAAVGFRRHAHSKTVFDEAAAIRNQPTHIDALLEGRGEMINTQVERYRRCSNRPAQIILYLAPPPFSPPKSHPLHIPGPSLPSLASRLT